MRSVSRVVLMSRRCSPQSASSASAIAWPPRSPSGLPARRSSRRRGARMAASISGPTDLSVKALNRRSRNSSVCRVLGRAAAMAVTPMSPHLHNRKLSTRSVSSREIAAIRACGNGARMSGLPGSTTTIGLLLKKMCGGVDSHAGLLRERRGGWTTGQLRRAKRRHVDASRPSDCTSSMRMVSSTTMRPPACCVSGDAVCGSAGPSGHGNTGSSRTGSRITWPCAHLVVRISPARPGTQVVVTVCEAETGTDGPHGRHLPGQPCSGSCLCGEGAAPMRAVLLAMDFNRYYSDTAVPILALAREVHRPHSPHAHPASPSTAQPTHARPPHWQPSCMALAVA
eukprot:m.66600 g.66600  ORF g.66600 m.66600 type:complete len:340 (+) comp7415_c0_seq1:1127-2146(+)